MKAPPSSTLALIDFFTLLTGALLVVLGVAMVSRPLALIVAGALLILMAIWPSTKRSE